MLQPPLGMRVFLACGTTDMRKGFDGLTAQVQLVLAQDPHGGALFAFRGRRGDPIKCLWRDGRAWCSTPSGWSAAGYGAVGEQRRGNPDRGAVVDAAGGD
jgi:hypothetical protein